MMKNGIFPLVMIVSLLFTACASEPYRNEEKLKEASKYNADLGLAYLRQGRNAIAMTKLSKAIEQNEDNAEAHHYIAELYRRLGKMEESEKHFKKALELTPNDSMLQNNYGVFLCQQEKYKEARVLFLTVLNDPLYKAKWQVYENIGLCAKLKGDVKTAGKYLHKALRANPRAAKSYLALAQINFDNQDYAAARKYYYKYLEFGRQNPASLWLGILLERRSGNHERVASYSVLLKGKFPDSKEAALLRKMEARARR